MIKRSVEGKRPLARTKCRWQDNIEVDLKEIGREGMDWIHLGQDRDQWRTLVSIVISLAVPLNDGKFLRR
jgi:hypothetical protein